MSRIFVDVENQPERDLSFAYTNQEGDVEEVSIYDNTVVDIRVPDNIVSIFTSDVPKLVKALKAAYKHIEGKDVNE